MRNISLNAETSPCIESSGSCVKPSITDHVDIGSASRFKGNYGAKNNQRNICLGTFKSETDATAIKLCKTEPHRNVPWTNITCDHKQPFQRKYIAEAISKNMREQEYYATKTPSYTLMFQKVLTASDVGRLNRLLIPKEYADKYFPKVDHDESSGVQISFYDDVVMKLWTFRYTYWKSSPSYVLTRGWMRFVKEKKLKAGDTVAFYMYANQQGSYLSVIDVKYTSCARNNIGTVGLGKNEKYGLVKEELEDQKPSVGGFKLFGVQIIL